MSATTLPTNTADVANAERAQIAQALGRIENRLTTSSTLTRQEVQDIVSNELQPVVQSINGLENRIATLEQEVRDAMNRNAALNLDEIQQLAVARLLALSQTLPNLPAPDANDVEALQKQADVVKAVLESLDKLANTQKTKGEGLRAWITIIVTFIASLFTFVGGALMAKIFEVKNPKDKTE